MRKRLCLIALIVAFATPVAAASGLRGMMHDWKAGARTTHDMLTGRAKYDENAIRAALQSYIDDAGQVVSQINGQSADARDIRKRFLGFQADAKTALGDVARPPALKADFSRVAADCESCHNAYN